MKRILAGLVCVGLVLGAGVAWSMTYEEAIKAVNEKGKEADSGKIKNDDFIDFCTQALFKAEESKAKAFILAQRGNAYRNKGDIQKARQDIDASIAENSTINAGYSRLGDFFYHAGNYAEAIDAYKKAASLSQSEEGKKQHIAFAEMATKMKNFYEFVEKNKEHTSGKLALKDFLNLCENVLQNDAKGNAAFTAYVLAMRGAAYFNSGDTKKAKNDAEAAIKSNDKAFEGYNVLSFVLEKEEKYEEAIKACDSAIAIAKKQDIKEGFAKRREALVEKQKSAVATAQKKDPCANIKTMDDWNKASPLWRMSNKECKPDESKANYDVISPSALFNAFKNNEVAANQQFLGKRVAIEGRIHSIESSLMGYPEIIFNVGSYGMDTVKCQFSKDAIERIAKMSKGQTILVIGTVRSYVMKSLVSLDECVFGVAKKK